MELTVSGLAASNGEAQLEHWRVDEEHSNSFTAWKRMGSPQSPTDQQYAQLLEAGKLARVAGEAKVLVREREAKLRFSLPRRGVSLLVVRWK